jgi:hypothetical protein
MRDASALLQAGGIVPPNAALPAGEPTDAVVARTFWPTPPLGERRVVRLVAESLVPGADAEASALGFSPRARARRRSAASTRPGFPGWALLNDPKNARYALEIVQDLKKAQRTAQSKPGHARDALIAVGAKLARTTPHFLPSFWEEAGRLFLAVGNHTYAAQSFEKAREAERQFGLAVDEQPAPRRSSSSRWPARWPPSRWSPTRARSAESKDKPQAYALFYDLCLRRTLGGVAPFAGLGKELRTLAKAAGLDTAAEERRFLKDALPSPPWQKCAAESWKTWRPSLIALAKAEPATASRLLDLFPDAFVRFRRRLQTGLDRPADGLRGLDAAHGARRRAGRGRRPAARWAHAARLARRSPRRRGDAHRNARAAPDRRRRAREPGAPGVLARGDRPAAAGAGPGAGRALVTPTEDDTLDLSHWAQGGADAPDLVRIAADARYAP